MCSHDISECPDCGNTNLENTGGREDDLVCSDCGLLIELEETKQSQDGPEEVAASCESGIRFTDKSVPTNSDEKTSEETVTTAMHEEGSTTTVDWEKKEITDEETTETKRESGWSAWYPCPECGSNKLIERIEEVLTVTVDEEGEITNVSTDGEKQYWKCANCEEELSNNW